MTQRVGFWKCHKQNIGEEPGHVKLGAGPDGAPGYPEKGSENWFLSSAEDTIVPRQLVFGYVVDLLLTRKSYYW